MDRIKLSIISPMYLPTEDMIRKTVQSIVTQLPDQPVEWILVIDGTKDKISEFPIFKEYLPFNLRTAVLTDNYGPSVARNVGFQMSRGDWIGYLDFGDELASDYIHRVLNLVDIYREVDLFFLSYIIHQDDKYYKVDHLQRSYDLTGYNLEEILKKQNCSIPMGVVHKRLPFVLEGGFQPGIVCGEDGILWRRIMESGFNCKPTNVLAGTYHVSQTGQSRTNRRFDMGGFAFDARNIEGSHGQYLDQDWYTNFHSQNWYE